MENTQLSLFGRTSQGHCLATMDKILEPCLKKSQKPKFQLLLVVDGLTPAWSEGMGVQLHGESLMRNIGEFPSVGVESFLSQILEDNAPEKYFLSAKACQGILRRAEARGKKLPEMLEVALMQQCLTHTTTNVQKNHQHSEQIAECQPEEQSSLNQEAKTECQGFTKESAQHSTLCRGGQRQPCIATLRDKTGTLRASAGAPKHESDWESLVLSKLPVLNDQGGQSINVDYDLSPTLRAEAHGNLPIVIQSATMGGNKKQNGLGVSLGGPLYTLDCRADHAVCYPTPANTLLAKGNLSFRGDQDNLVACSTDVIRIGYAVRRLMPIECERLQGYPDNWTARGSDTARYKALGNSVAIPCVQFIMSRLAEALRLQKAVERYEKVFGHRPLSA